MISFYSFRFIFTTCIVILSCGSFSHNRYHQLGPNKAGKICVQLTQTIDIMLLSTGKGVRLERGTTFPMCKMSMHTFLLHRTHAFYANNNSLLAHTQIIVFWEYCIPGNGVTWDAWGNLGQCPIFWLCHSDDYRLQSFAMKLQHNFIYSLFITSRPYKGMNMCAVPPVLA